MARTRANIGTRTYSGEACSNCGTSYAKCTALVLGSCGHRAGRACCPTCGHMGTHDERQEFEKQPLLYAVNAIVNTAGSSRAIPTFYLDSRVQGITDARHAREIVEHILDPFGNVRVEAVVEAVGELESG